MAVKYEEVIFASISLVSFPFRSRKYLMDILKQLVIKEKASFIIVAGGMIAGKFLQEELKRLIKEKGLKKADQKAGFTAEFIDEKIKALDKFIPRIRDINYHITLDKKYDYSIGAQILEGLQKIRDDIRLIVGAEPKIPIEGLDGINYVRVLTPQRQLWYYKNITGAPQRIINSFLGRTFSPKPPLIIVGCTGVDSFLPFYAEIPCISLPALHKLDEQTSAENTVGITFIKMNMVDEKLRIRKKTYDLKEIIVHEREMLINSQNLSDNEKLILKNFIDMGSMSQGTLASKWTLGEEEFNKAFAGLNRRQFFIFDSNSNRYSLNEGKLNKVKISMDDLQSDSIIREYLVFSCPHFGALKTLYFTFLNILPKFLESDKDIAIICCGDVIQGLEHGLEYSGEVLPIAIGYDKQEILAAHVVATMLAKVFEKRLVKIDKTLPIEQIIENCLPPFIFIPGNHDLWVVKGKQSLPLCSFEERLKNLLMENILKILSTIDFKILSIADFKDINQFVNKKVIRVGENGVLNFKSVNIGLAHPHKARTLNMGQRLQEIINYHKAKGADVSIECIGNFHEAAYLTFSKFEETIVGVMAGALVAQTDFEDKKQKKVDIGFVLERICLSQNKNLIFSEVEFISDIDPKDKDVLKDTLLWSDLSALADNLLEKINLSDLPWR